MLKIEEISKGKIPQEVWNKFGNKSTIDDFIECYKSEGMFGIEFDYLLILRINYSLHNEYNCYGYVYNGNSPEFSEFGSFGLNKQKTERIW